MNEREILMKNDTISVMRHLKSCAKMTFDVEGLVKIAFEDLKPFPHRQAIKSKQAFYLTSLKEKYKRRELQKMAFAEREHMFMALEAESGSFLSFECCTTSPSGEIWLCYGEQNQSHVCRVNCYEGVMLDISMEFDSKMMSMVALPNNIVFYGSLSWLLYSYDMQQKKERWHIRLHDAVLSVCTYTEDDHQFRIFAGLADGTVAIIENGESAIAPIDVMYIPVGQSPVTCVMIIGKQLWCACGNTVHVIHAGTLDAMDNFTVSSNPYDHILSLEPSMTGVFISVRGSSILELWDPQTLSCKMLYDTRSCRYPNLRKEDDAYFNRARITSIMSYENTVWVGTGEGNLMIYDVIETGACKTPSEQSFTGSLAENLCLVTDENDPIRKVEEKVRDMYYRKLNEGINLSPVKQDSQVATTPSSPINITGKASDNMVAMSVGSTIFVGNVEESISVKNKFLSSTPLNSPDKRLKDKVNVTKETESEFHSSQGSFWFDSCGDSFSHHCQHGGNSNEDGDTKGRRKLFDDSHSSELCNGHLMEESEGSTGTVNDDTHDSKTTKDVFPDGHIPSKNDLLSRYVLAQSKSVLQKMKEKKKGDNLITESTEVISSGEHKSHSFDVVEMPESANSSLVVIDSEHSGEAVEKENNEKSRMGKLDNESIVNAINEANKTDITDTELSTGVTSGFAGDSGHVSDISDSVATTNNSPKSNSANKDTYSVSNQLNNKCVKCTDNSSTLRSDIICTCNKTRSNGHVDNFISLQKTVQDLDCVTCKSQSCDCYKNKSDNNKRCANCENCKNGNICSNFNSTGTSSCGTSRNTSVNKLSARSEDSQVPQSTDSELDQDDVFTDANESPFHSRSTLAVSEQDEEATTPTRQITMADSFLGNNKDSENESSVYSLKSAKEELTPNRSSSSSFLSDHSRLESSSTVPEKFQPKNREAQYRIDFTNIQVDTDVESNVSFSLHGSLSSEADYKQVEEFLHQKNGLSGIDPASLIFPADFDISSLDNTDDKLMQLYNNNGCFGTPKSNQTWSSYDEISTPSRVDVDSVSARSARPNMLRVNSIQSNISAATSIISATTMSESLYSADLCLQAKVKISDKPVKCLLKDTSQADPIMLSMSGSYGDDEAVLKWRKEANEMMWTNEPILEICPHTKIAKMPNYMRRLSLMSSPGSSDSSVISMKRLNMSQ
ncbi:hypothetical protein SNE40_000364 [Patella caerulea]|uniref:Uncharacterized protein n=1 Tax=Patella caerulea TaxID=87958 RepID=A0AAN8Q1G2_PATCE